MWSRHIMAARYCHHALKCDVAVMVVQGQCGGDFIPFLSWRLCGQGRRGR